MSRTRAKPIYAVLAGVVLGLLVMPIALAGGAKDPEATASATVEKQIKKLKKQVKKLRQQVQEVSRQPGPAGEQGPAGQQGPAGPSTGPAGGDLTGSYPNPLIGPDAVGSSEIADEAVGIDDIGRNAVGTGQIADNNVGSEDIANDSVGSSEIASNAVGGAEIQDSSISGVDIGDGSVTSRDLGNDAVLAPELGPTFAVVGTGVLVGPGQSREATVTCPDDSRLLGGGFEWLSDASDGNSVISSSPAFVGDPNKTWVVTGRNDTGGAGNTIFAEALCLAA